MKKTIRFSLLSFMLMLVGSIYAGNPTKVITFPATGGENIGSYTTDWTATVGEDVWQISGFNPNKNGWAYIRCGRSGNDHVASITSPAVDAAITNVVVAVDKTSNVTAATLEVLNGETVVKSYDVTSKFEAGDLDFAVEGAAGNSYKLTIASSSASANGTTQISKIALYEAGQYVEVHIANTIDEPYTVAKAIELINAGDALSETVFVKGIISKIDEVSTKYGNATYWISDDGKSAQFECYQGLGLNGEKFTKEDEIEVGDTVIVTGTLTLYNTIYEFNKGNKIVYYGVAPKYIVNEVFGDNIFRTTKGAAALGSTVKVPYRAYNVLDGVLYNKGVTNKEYNTSFTFNEDGQTVNIAYAAEGTKDIVFLSEGEDIAGLTRCTSANAAIRSSNSAAAYAAEGDVEIVKLPAGAYKLTAVIHDASKSPDSHWIFKAGENQIADLHCTAVNYQKLTSQKFILNEETAIYLAQGGNGNMGVDLIYIQQVPVETVYFTYTLNEMVDGKAVRVTTGKDEEGASVKLPYRRYNVVDGKLYTKGATSKEYNTSFTLNEDAKVVNLDYTDASVSDVVYLSEGEDIEGMTVINTGNTAIRSSNSASGYAKDGNVEFVTLPSGKYQIVAGLYDANKNPASSWTILAGENELLTLDCTQINLQEVKSDEFDLAEETKLSIAQGGATNVGIDYIYIVKTGVYVGITNVESADAEANAIYNLQGQRLQKAQKGLNIIGGKKVLVK
jgi:hypothetical protein